MGMWNSSLSEEVVLGKGHLGEVSLQAPAPHRHLALGAKRKQEASDILGAQALCWPQVSITLGTPRTSRRILGLGVRRTSPGYTARKRQRKGCKVRDPGPCSVSSNTPLVRCSSPASVI